MTDRFVLAHLKAFRARAAIGAWTAQAPEAWATSVGIPALSPSFSSKTMTRAVLKSASTDESVSDRDLLWGVLAWGKMRRDAARRLAKNEAAWTEVVNRLRNGGLTRAESYRLCSDAVARMPAGGIGPAYYTKLIFFANPRHDGYIMDQWTSRSVNLLVSGDPVVRMRTKTHVDPRNDDLVFETYCQIVEDLSGKLTGKTAEETEQCLFSEGGRNRQPWRDYVMSHG
ncbi:hypothetical protein [Defluviimonas salinarum]|uniref:Uncharacterized protein n=1 Tax=Defluviimonas salinarum TaxID=2992147 RepID=A0ABT3J5D2_9RHOB|nr:hypothetical protein [Defluviimonas salinarum]MCW3782902.1 hypothetical protein [Defluviimonas salinarum]